MTDDGWKGGQDSQAYVDHLKAEAMTDARDIEKRAQTALDQKMSMTVGEAGSWINLYGLALIEEAASLRKQLFAYETEAIHSCHVDCERPICVMRRQLEDARDNALEEAAAIVDQCNREGPYNAIGAAKRIRALKGKS